MFVPYVFKDRQGLWEGEGGAISGWNLGRGRVRDRSGGIMVGKGDTASHGSGSRREGRGKLQLEHGQGGEGGRDEEFTSGMTPREGWSLGPTKI